MIENLADLVERLGGIPLDRIRVQPPPGAATEQDALLAADREPKRLCELVDGVLVEKAMGYSESSLATRLIFLIQSFVEPRNLGIVTGEAGMIRLLSGRVRIPDVAFVSWDRLPNRQMPSAPIPSLAPDLAIEVLSVRNTSAEMMLKREDYFSAGVSIVWEVDPKTRTVNVYESNDAPITLSANDVLNGGSVLPGFSVSLRDLFAVLDRKG